MAKPTKTKPSQASTFRKAARELGCDESEERFKDALRTVAKHKPVEPSDRELGKHRGGR